jgi:hypothetical protein
VEKGRKNKINGNRDLNKPTDGGEIQVEQNMDQWSFEGPFSKCRGNGRENKTLTEADSKGRVM